MLNIAIDGPCGAGKSTVAKALAGKLGIRHLDTGSLYRAVAVKLIRANVDVGDEIAVERTLAGIDIRLEATENGFLPLVDGWDVSKEIRGPEVSKVSTAAASLPCVRVKLLELQREVARNMDVVVDGRDIGTCVLPHTRNKFFLTATAEVRAARLRKDQIQSGKQVALEEVMEEVRYRDETDIHREHSPLRQAQDAMLIDTSDLSVSQVVDRVARNLRV